MPVREAQRGETRGVLLEMSLNLPLEEEETPGTSYAAAESLAATVEFLGNYSEELEAFG